jgi:hypothetical protein
VKKRKKVEKGKKVKMKSEKKRDEEKTIKKAMTRGRRWPWGVPTYPGAWTANLQLPCGSGLRVEGLLPIPFGRFLRGRCGACQHLPEGCPLSAGHVLDQVSQLDFVALAVGLVSP